MASPPPIARGTSCPGHVLVPWALSPIWSRQHPIFVSLIQIASYYKVGRPGVAANAGFAPIANTRALSVSIRVRVRAAALATGSASGGCHERSRLATWLATRTQAGVAASSQASETSLAGRGTGQMARLEPMPRATDPGRAQGAWAAESKSIFVRTRERFAAASPNCCRFCWVCCLCFMLFTLFMQLARSTLVHP